MPSETTPYAITVNLTGIFQTLYWAGVVVLVFQGIFLLTSLFGNNRSIRKVLRPLQELAATASRLSSMTHMSRQELEALLDPARFTGRAAGQTQAFVQGTIRPLLQSHSALLGARATLLV